MSESTTTAMVAHCQVCGVEWAIQSPNMDDARGCSFCDAPESAITVVSEVPGHQGQVVRG